EAAAQDAADDGQPERDALVAGNDQLGEQAEDDARDEKAEDAPPVERLAERFAEASSERVGVCHDFSSLRVRTSFVRNCPTTWPRSRFESAPGGPERAVEANSLALVPQFVACRGWSGSVGGGLS